MAMVVNNARDSVRADREGLSTRLDKWTVISGAVLLMAATLTAFLAPEEGRPPKPSDGRNPLRDGTEDTAPRDAPAEAAETRDQADRGRLASSPSEIPARGWKDILQRVYANISEHRVLALAAGMTYYSLLAIFPAIAALVAIYGLFSDPTAITRHLDQMSRILPGGAVDVARNQLTRVASKGSGTLGATFAIGLVISLWSANAAMKSLFDTLNIVYGEKEKRGFLKLNAISLSFTLAGIVFVLAALGALVVIPVVLNFIGLSNFADLMMRVARWPAMFVAVGLALALIYRYGPSREAPRWRWITWGSAAAAVLWLVTSALFLLVRGQLREIQRNLRLPGGRDRLHDLALDFGHRHSAGGRTRRRDGAPDGARHHNRLAEADRDAGRHNGRHRRTRPQPLTFPVVRAGRPGAGGSPRPGGASPAALSRIALAPKSYGDAKNRRDTPGVRTVPPPIPRAEASSSRSEAWCWLSLCGALDYSTPKP
jgi:membrane protein